MQIVIVYIVIALALAGACRYGYRKIKALKKNKNATGCSSCPLKEGCQKADGKDTGSSSCCS